MEARYRVLTWLPVVWIALLLQTGTLLVPLLDPDEARFARGSVEMLRSGDLVVPHFEGRPRLVKPPLVHWIQAALFSVFGDGRWTARLHSTLATLATLLVLGHVVRLRFGAEGAFWAVLCLSTMPLVLILGTLGTLDALLGLHVWAVVALDLAGGESATGGARRGLLVGALLGLAFLIKGPVGVVLPLLIVLAGRTASGRDILPAWRPLLPALLGWCGVVLPWAVPFLGRVGRDSAASTLRHEVLERYFAGTEHIEPVWFYLPVVVVGCLPWIAPLLIGIGRAVLRGTDPASRTARYAAGGFVVGLAFFSISPSKLPSYILPLVPLAAIVVSWELGQELRAPRRRTLGPSLLAATLGAFAVAFFIAGGDRAELHTVGLIGVLVYGLGALSCLQPLYRRKPRRVYATAGVAAALFLPALVLLLNPAIARTRTAAYLTQQVPVLSSGRPLVVVDMKVPSLTYYLDRVPEQVSMARLQRRLDRGDDALYVFDEDDLAAVPESLASRLEELGRQGKYVVYQDRE